METIYILFSTLRKQVEQEDIERSKIIYSDAYVELNKKIDALKAQQEEMLSAIPNSAVEMETAKKDLIAAMKVEGLSHFKNAVARYKERKEVNRSKVMEVIGGDWDTYMSISNITQVSLKDFAKSNPLIKNELMDCVESVGKEFVDLELVS